MVWSWDDQHGSWRMGCLARVVARDRTNEKGERRVEDIGTEEKGCNSLSSGKIDVTSHIPARPAIAARSAAYAVVLSLPSSAPVPLR